MVEIAESMKKILLYLILFLTACASVDAGRNDDKYVIGFYNLENLFDTVDDPQKNDEDFLPEGRNQWTEDKYRKKLDNMAKVIRSMAMDNGTYPTVLGVCEVENEKVMNDLAGNPQISEAAYEVIHYDSPDGRGIDVALLYRPDQFKVKGSKSIPFTFKGSSIDFVLDAQEMKNYRTRDILMVHGMLAGEHFAFYVAHLPSRAGDKKGRDQLRQRGAEIMYDHAMSMMKKYPGIKIVCMGDMNDNPIDTSMTEYMHGRGRVEEVGTEDFFCPYNVMLMNGFGTLSYKGIWNIYDLQLVNHALVHAPDGGLKILSDKKGYYGNIYERDFLTNTSGKYKGTPFRSFAGGQFLGGYSDHYPTYIIIGK